MRWLKKKLKRRKVMLSWYEWIIWVGIIGAWGVGLGWALADYWLHEGPWLDIRYHRGKRRELC